jgi:very-short-patch-repair endonuclease
MTSRPYQTKKIDDLERLFRENRKDSGFVDDLWRELQYRSTQRSRELRARVAKARTSPELGTAAIDAPPVKATKDLKTEAIASRKRPDSGPHPMPRALSRVIQNAHQTARNDEADLLRPPSTDRFKMLDANEQARLASLYEQLRIKLLDLTKKNRMLNYPLGSRSRRQLQVVDEVLGEVYSKLVEEETALTIAYLEEPTGILPDEKTEEFVSAFEHARISDVEFLVKTEALASAGGETDAAYERLEHALRDRVRALLGLPPRPKRAEVNRNDHARTLGIDPNAELKPVSSKKAHSDGALQTLKYPDELEAVLEKIADEARLAEQEAGLSTLFLSFGFLEWYESDDSEKPLYAPLLLLPVRVEREKIRGKDVYRVATREGAAEINVSLQKFLETERGRVLPDFETTDTDDADAIENYFAQVHASIEGLKRWQVRRWLVLGHFAFSRIAIYEDTKPERWPDHPATDPLVGSLLTGFEQGAASDGSAFGAPEDYHIDDPAIESAAPILIHDADASQHSAIVDVMKKKNLVIQGPPGTGKSQTITNIIANMLAAGKTVLFLAEKQAALDVVKRRLDAAGLGDFCLELHSEKASPKAVVQSLERRHQLGIGRLSKQNQPTSDSIRGFARTQIAEYLEALHEEAEDGATPFNLIWRSVRGRSLNADIPAMLKGIDIPLSQVIDPITLQEMRGKLEIFANSAQAFCANYGHPSLSPWNITSPNELAAFDREPLLSAIGELRQSTMDLLLFIEAHQAIGIASYRDAEAVLSASRTVPPPQEPLTIASIAHIDIDGLERALALQSSYLAAVSETSTLANLEHVDSTILSRASELMGLPYSDGLAALRPSECYALAESRIARSRRFLDTVEALAPALSTLGLDQSMPTDALDAVTWVTRVAATMNSAQRSWVRADQIDSEAFAELLAKWTALSSEAGELANSMDLDSTTHADPEALEAAAATLAKTGFRKLLENVRGRSKAARDIAANLGIRAPAPVAATLLLRLARHTRSVSVFNRSADGAAALGPHWKGMATPFSSINSGIEIRQKIDAELRKLPNGNQVAAAFWRLPENGIEALSSHIESARNYDAARDSFGEILVEQCLDAALERCRDDITRCEQRLKIDPDRALSAIDLPIADLAAIDAARRRLAKAHAAVEASTYKIAIQSLALDKDSLQRTADTVTWIRSIRSSELPGAIRDGLLSAQAAEWHQDLKRVAASYLQLRSSYDAAQKALATFQMPGMDTFDLSASVHHMDALIEHRKELGDFISLKSSRGNLAAMGLTDFLNKADACRLSPTRLLEVFEATVSRLRADAARRASVALSQRTGSDLESKRKIFAGKDKQKIVIDRELVRARLLANQPASGVRYGSVKTWTQMSLLANEFPKQKRFTPVRGLIGRAGQAISSLKPCFMMSPLSLAKFVPAGTLRFDALVIDEASQMRPEDALGAMLRADQIIVVGDPKQLPPTSFFDRSSSDQNGDDGDQDDIDDESILERCQKVFREVRRLKWHYRSRCESLIRFSNENFYDNSLITFPAARPDSFSIDLIRVDGAYQARRNVAEAERVAEEAVAFMRHFAASEADVIPSLGIVALNTDQRDLIQETLRHVSMGDELVERYRDAVEARGEPVFIKNLENVQGDERDFIFISMTYGREPGATAMKQRFGPINSKQGHRRLNVLFSRARVRIGLFASFGSADVKPAETSNEGMRVLKRYLEYSEVRGRAPVESIGGEADSDFEIEVADRLTRLGYPVDMQVGVSGYKIDLGVRHPEHPEVFLAGIECDGAAYHSSKSARDRDRLREDVLRGLGWELLRVWSTDWFDDPDSQMDRLAKRLEELRSRPLSAYSDYTLQGTYSPISARATEPWADEAEGEAPSSAPPEAVPIPRSTDMDEDGDALLSSEGTLTEAQGFKALAALRDRVIRPATPDWEPQRSILRDSMIETFVRQRISDPENWFRQVPHYQRSGTDPVEKRLYLDRICAVIDRIR